MLVGKDIVERMHETGVSWNSGLRVWGLTTPCVGTETTSLQFYSASEESQFFSFRPLYQVSKSLAGVYVAGNCVVFSYSTGNSYPEWVSFSVDSEEILAI